MSEADTDSSSGRELDEGSGSDEGDDCDSVIETELNVSAGQ